MTGRISYTPDAVALIRQRAPQRSATEIARELVWDMPFLRNVATRHGIELLGGDGPAVQEQTDEPDSRDAPRSRSRVRLVEGHAREQFPRGRELDALSLDQIVDLLPTPQAAVLTILRSMSLSGTFISGEVIAERLGVSRVAVHAAAMRVSAILSKGSRYRVRTNKGPGGGYSLARCDEESS